MLKSKKFLALAAMLLMTGAVQANESTLSVVSGDSLKWSDVKNIPGAKVAVLSGNPEKNEPFVARIKLPANYHVLAHTHPINEYDTVISGALYFQVGDKKENQTKLLTANDFVMIPAKLMHHSWTKDETVLQVSGIGPWKTIYVN